MIDEKTLESLSKEADKPGNFGMRLLVAEVRRLRQVETDMNIVWRLMYPTSPNEPYLPMMLEWITKMRHKLKNAECFLK